MNIYVGHSTKYPFKELLYQPIKETRLYREHFMVLPHEETDELFDTRLFLEKCDLFIADVTYPSLGLGIELGWANEIGVPIIAISQAGNPLSKSVGVITKDMYQYQNEAELKEILDTKIVKRNNLTIEINQCSSDDFWYQKHVGETFQARKSDSKAFEYEIVDNKNKAFRYVVYGDASVVKNNENKKNKTKNNEVK